MLVTKALEVFRGNVIRHTLYANVDIGFADQDVLQLFLAEALHLSREAFCRLRTTSVFSSHFASLRPEGILVSRNLRN
jgi:hypothetical protein